MSRIFWTLLLLVVVLPAQGVASDPLRELTAKAAIAVDHRTGAVLYARDPDSTLPPASTTKVLTAYVAVRSGKLDRDLRVSSHASRTEPSKIWLRPGWKVNALDLVYAILLNSANDASVVLAEGLSGSVPKFAHQMNLAARDLGATRSHFVNPNGLPEANHYSTARDLATIMQGALRYPLIRDILTTPNTVIQPASGSQRKIRLRSHNRLLPKQNGVQVIGKTGYTRLAKRCFVGAASNGDQEVIVAVLGARDLWGDAQRLVNYGLGRTSGSGYQLTEAEWHKVIQPSETRRDERRRAQAAPDGRYHVRLASFRARSQADGLRKAVTRHGYRNVVVERLRKGTKPLYRVTVRGFTSKQAATKAAQTLGRTYKVRPQIVLIGA